MLTRRGSQDNVVRMMFAPAHKTQPVVFQLFLVTLLVVAHCCMFTMPAHAGQHVDQAAVHMAAHAGMDADAFWQVDGPCCDSAPVAVAARAEISDDSVLLPSYGLPVVATVVSTQGHPLRGPPDPAPALRVRLQIFQI